MNSLKKSFKCEEKLYKSVDEGFNKFNSRYENFSKEYIDWYYELKRICTRTWIGAKIPLPPITVYFPNGNIKDYDILNELIRIMKKINIYIWCNKKQLLQYLNFFDEYNCMFECIIWNKYNCIPLTCNTYLPDKEYCLYFKEKGITLNNTYETSKTIYSIPINVADKKVYKHPTIKPLEIVKNTILNSSKENDIVLDCFAGSGTTCVAAKETGRRYIGMEIDPEYHKIAVNRINGITANGQTSIFTDFSLLEKNNE